MTQNPPGLAARAVRSRFDRWGGATALQQQIGALFTDLYEVTMAQAYPSEQMFGTAVVETFFGKLPPTASHCWCRS